MAWGRGDRLVHNVKGATVSQFELMGQDMDAVTGESALSSTIHDECSIYHDMPGGMYDPGFCANEEGPVPPLADDPNVQQALDNLQNAIDAGPGGIDARGFFGVPWPWIAGGLLVALIVRR